MFYFLPHPKAGANLLDFMFLIVLKCFSEVCGYNHGNEVFIILSFISKTALFQGCTEEDILNMSEHLDFRTDKYKKGDVIFGTGNIVTDIDLILSGSVRIEHTDLWGE